MRRKFDVGDSAKILITTDKDRNLWCGGLSGRMATINHVLDGKYYKWAFQAEVGEHLLYYFEDQLLVTDMLDV